MLTFQWINFTCLPFNGSISRAYLSIDQYHVLTFQWISFTCLPFNKSVSRAYLSMDQFHVLTFQWISFTCLPFNGSVSRPYLSMDQFHVLTFQWINFMCLPFNWSVSHLFCLLSEGTKGKLILQNILATPTPLLIAGAASFLFINFQFFNFVVGSLPSPLDLCTLQEQQRQAVLQRAHDWKQKPSDYFEPDQSGLRADHQASDAPCWGQEHKRLCR